MDTASVQADQLILDQTIAQLTLIQTITNFVLLLVTVVSVICAFRAYQHQKLRAQKECACSLANLYAHEILEQLCLISAIFKQSGYAEKIKESFPFNKIKDFSVQEAKSLVGEEKYEELIKELYSIPPAIIYANKIRMAKTIEERHMLSSEYITYSKDTHEFKMIHTDILQQEFHDYMVSFLNSLEWFTMNFQYNLADEKILYQSLHQTFLSNVWSLYLNISINNRPGADKYYTNIIWLFNYWKDRLQQLEEQALKEKRDKSSELEYLKSVCEQANQQYEAAKKEQDSQLPIYTGKPL